MERCLAAPSRSIGAAATYYYYYYSTSQVQETLPDGQILGIWGKLVATAAQTMSGDLVGGFSFRREGRQNQKMLGRRQ